MREPDPTPEQPHEELPARVVLDGLPPRRPLSRRLLPWALFLVVALAGAAALAGAVAWVALARGLPDIPTLEQYRPPIVTEVISADGQLAGEFFVERRKVVPFERIPPRLVQAFLASEDKNFFEHRGIDLLGTARAALNTYVLRRRVQGGSTITQQTAKAILISAEGFEQGTRKSLRRKLRELI